MYLTPVFPASRAQGICSIIPLFGLKLQTTISKTSQSISLTGRTLRHAPEVVLPEGYLKEHFDIPENASRWHGHCGKVGHSCVKNQHDFFRERLSGLNLVYCNQHVVDN